MSELGGNAGQPGNGDGEGGGPRDLFDFYRRWPEFRQTAVTLSGRTDLSGLERQIVHWLILLADRVSEHDLRSPKR